MKLRRQVFLEITTDSETWKLPENYKCIVTPHLDSLPTSIYCPWPLDLIPQAGSVVWMPYFADKEMKVEEVEYDYRPEKKLVTVYVKMFRDDKNFFGIDALTTMAETGGLFEDKTPISKALRSAGLPTTIKALKQTSKK